MVLATSLRRESFSRYATRTELLSDRLAPVRALSIDRPLDLEQPEQRIDPADHLQRHSRLFALSLATRVLGQTGHNEERTRGVNPTSSFQDRPRPAAQLIELWPDVS